MGWNVFAAAACLGCAAPAAAEQWGKALIFESGAYGRGIPSMSPAMEAYPGVAKEVAEVVLPVVEAIARASKKELGRVGGLADPLPVSRGEYPSPTGTGVQYYAREPLETLRAKMGSCSAGALESLGEDTKTGSHYVMVKFDCPGARAKDWRNPYGAFLVREGRVQSVTINIGDLPNLRITPLG